MATDTVTVTIAINIIITTISIIIATATTIVIMTIDFLSYILPFNMNHRQNFILVVLILRGIGIFSFLLSVPLELVPLSCIDIWIVIVIALIVTTTTVNKIMRIIIHTRIVLVFIFIIHIIPWDLCLGLQFSFHRSKGNFQVCS